jgi:hypothetical protein
MPIYEDEIIALVKKELAVKDDALKALELVCQEMQAWLDRAPKVEEPHAKA